MSRNSSKTCNEWLSVKLLQFMSRNSVKFVIKRADFSPCSLNGFQNMCFIPICWELFISWGEKTVAVGSSQNRDEIYYIIDIIFDWNYVFNCSWIPNNVTNGIPKQKKVQWALKSLPRIHDQLLLRTRARRRGE